MLEEDACVQKNWHAVREWLHSQISKEPPHWDVRRGLMGMSDLLQRAPSASHDWQILEESACPMGEIALLFADFLLSGDRSLLELGLIMMRRLSVSRVLISTWPLFGLLLQAREALSALGDAFAEVCEEAAPVAAEMERLGPGLGNSSLLRSFRRKIEGRGQLGSCYRDKRARAAAHLLAALASHSSFHDPRSLESLDLSSFAEEMGTQWPWLLFRNHWPTLSLLHQLQVAWREAACSQAWPDSYGQLTVAAPVSTWMCTVPWPERERNRWLYAGHYIDCTSIVRSVLDSYSPCLVLDVGANMGCIGLSLAKEHFQVIAVEPGPKMSHLLRGAAAKNGFSLGQLTVVEAAAGSTTGSTVLYCGNSSGMCTSAVTSEYLEGRDTQHTVQQVTLSSVVGQRSKEVCVIKLDVEGSEEDVLHGADLVLRDGTPAIYIDIHEDMLRKQGKNVAGVWDVLSRHGYRQLVDYSQLDCLYVGQQRWKDFMWQKGLDLKHLLTLEAPFHSSPCFCHSACAERMFLGCRCWDFGHGSESADTDGSSERRPQCNLYLRCPTGWSQAQDRANGLVPSVGWFANDLFGRWIVTK
ncbi:unnamed protein product [Symbiodinium necroappetens]|uniref:Methyltransferase FkbM domain-containing protein n=1 Tax=Symbiodinium necroappetens TaxID=1628268 RepID=A0A812ZH92_9DINO|nr:unnamed protein product [Symbiodinium necroappetens]